MSKKWSIVSNFVCNEQVEKIQILWTEKKIILSVKDFEDKPPMFLAFSKDDKTYYEFKNLSIIDKESCIYDDSNKPSTEKLTISYQNWSKNSIIYQIKAKNIDFSVNVMQKDPLIVYCSKECLNTIAETNCFTLLNISQNLNYDFYGYNIKKKTLLNNGFYEVIFAKESKVSVLSQNPMASISQETALPDYLFIGQTEYPIYIVNQSNTKITFTSKAIPQTTFAPQIYHYRRNFEIDCFPVYGYLTSKGNDTWQISLEKPLFEGPKLHIDDLKVNYDYLQCYNKFFNFKTKEKLLLKSNKEYLIKVPEKDNFVATFIENKGKNYYFRVNPFKNCTTATVSDALQETKCRVEVYPDKSFCLYAENEKQYGELRGISQTKRILIKHYDELGKTIKVEKLDNVNALSCSSRRYYDGIPVPFQATLVC